MAYSRNFVFFQALKHPFEGKNSLLFKCLFFLFPLVYSCSPEPIDIVLPPFESKLVIATQIIPQQFMVVGVSRSFSALDNAQNNGDSASQNFLDSLAVTRALVTISYSGRIDTLFLVQPGIYVSLNTLQVDYGVYTLMVRDSSTGQSISSTSTILPKVAFTNVFPVLQKTEKDTSIRVEYSFTDRPGEDNWYVVNFYIKKSGEDTHFDLNAFNSIGSSQLLSNFELLSDKTFEQDTFKSTSILYEASPSDSIAISISNISEGYFQFLNAYKKSGNFFNQITGEAINYPTNIINGYGYFNTHYPDIKVFDLKNY
jgi:hypothetical protein